MHARARGLEPSMSMLRHNKARIVRTFSEKNRQKEMEEVSVPLPPVTESRSEVRACQPKETVASLDCLGNRTSPEISNTSDVSMKIEVRRTLTDLQ